jgi:DNA polymerase
MRDLIVLDFETYYDKEYSLSKLTTQQYIDDPRFEVIGVAVKVNDGPTEWFSGTKDETYNFLRKFDWGNSMALAHNSMFDASILTWQFDLIPYLWLDTLSMSRAVHGTEVGGSLAKLSAHYRIGEKGTEVVNALGKRRLDFSPSELQAYADYCILDVELTHRLLAKLAPSFDKTEIRLIDMTIRMHSEPSLKLDLPILEEHLHSVRATKAMLLMQCYATRETLMSNNKFAEILKGRNVIPPTKISKTTGKLTYAFAKTDEGMKRLLEHPDPEVQALAAARVGTKSTIEETRTERFIAMAKSGGALPVPLKYYGAMTGRWAAADKTNLQNIPRGSKLKEAIVAPEGYKIVGADLSNIELRVGLYFAGQIDKLNLLRDGVDLYKDFAAPVFDVPYDQVTDEQRFLGKTSQLSLIYGTGAAKLRAAILQMANKDIGETFSDYVVKLYRQQYPQVQASWYQAKEVLEAMMRNDDTFIMGQPDLLPLNVHGGTGILLPSGLYLAYPDLKTEYDPTTNQTKTTYASRKERIHIHGAKCFQNVIQALARCVMGEAMVRIAKTVPVALTIHDAVYCVVPESEVESTKRLIVSELKKEPSWAPGLPLDAECGAGQSLSFKMSKLQ